MYRLIILLLVVFVLISFFNRPESFYGANILRQADFYPLGKGSLTEGNPMMTTKHIPYRGYYKDNILRSDY